MFQAPLPTLPPSPMEIAIAVTIVVGTVGSMGILWLLIRGWVQRWNAPPALPAGDRPALEDMKQTVAQLSAEVADLHERMDFAERVLAPRDAARPPGMGR